MNKKEYIKKWAEKLVGYITEKYDNMEDAENEAIDAIEKHMKWLCEDVEIELKSTDYIPESDDAVFYTYEVTCDDEKITIRAIAYSRTDFDVEIDRVN